MQLKFGKLLLVLAAFFLSNHVKCEITQVKLYFDKNWSVCKPEVASYYRICNWDSKIRFYEGGFTDFQTNGTKIAEGNYNLGLKNGEFKFYFENGSEKITAFFTNDKPDRIWSWYYPNKLVHFKIDFTNDNLNITEINNESGNSVMSYAEFVYAFQNDPALNTMKIIGTIKDNKKEGKWKIVGQNKTVGYDLYKKDTYIRTNYGISDPSSLNNRIISSKYFIPYALYVTESIYINEDVSEKDYPIFNYLFKWEAIESANGIIGDSTIHYLDQKPMYSGGIKSINASISNHIRLSIEAILTCKDWGHVYYEILIDENGKAVAKNIIKSPSKLLSEIALKSLNHLTYFKPAYHNGVAIKSKFVSRISFEKPKLIF